MILRKENLNTFKLTKEYNITYYLHTYYKKAVCPKKFINGKITKNELENIKNQTILLKWYFTENNDMNKI